jgi:hypothetical protein
MADYTNEQLLEALKEQGADTSKFGTEIGRPEEMNTAGLETTVPQPLEIMSMAQTMGLVVSWMEVVPYILCVIGSIWDKPLKQALQDCAPK